MKRTPVTHSPSPVVRFALKDRASGDLYPLRACPCWTDAFWVLDACRRGEDAGLPVPPPRGAHLRIVELLDPAEAARRAGERAARRAHIDAEIASLFPPSVFASFPSPPEADSRPPLWARATEWLLNLLCRDEAALLGLAAGAALLLLRRAL